ncbi:hypothetical protein HanPSC8_Chr17g0792551 [Helianthus annuus]|nr:hypothetical protein HanPSC8_Chr17g0792551 [Helianthus annuus]
MSLTQEISHHTSPKITLSFPLLVLGRRLPTTIHHFRALINPFQVYTSLTGHVLGALEQTEAEGPQYLAFIHLIFA